MASSTDRSVSPSQTSPFVFGGARRPSVQLSLLGSSEGNRADSTSQGEDAREVLKNLKKEDEQVQRRGKKGAFRRRGSLQSKYEFTVEDKALLQKGILPAQDRNSATSSSFMDSLQAHPPHLPHPPRSSSAEPDKFDGEMYVNDKFAQQSLLSLNAVLNIPTTATGHMTRGGECPGSPDSGYGNTPDNTALKLGALSPNSRSRSCSSEASTATADSSDTAGRRTSPNSGHWSGHEPALRLVAEEEGRGDSACGAGGGDNFQTREVSREVLAASPQPRNGDARPGDIPSAEDSPQFYLPGEDILLHIPSRTPRSATTQPQHRSELKYQSSVDMGSVTQRRVGEGLRWRRGRLRTQTSAGRGQCVWVLFPSDHHLINTVCVCVSVEGCLLWWLGMCVMLLQGAHLTHTKTTYIFSQPYMESS